MAVLSVNSRIILFAHITKLECVDDDFHDGVRFDVIQEWRQNERKALSPYLHNFTFGVMLVR